MNQHPQNIKYFLILPAVIYLFLLIIYPLIYSIQVSLTTLNLARPSYRTEFIGLGNFAELVKDPIFFQAIRNTFVLTALSVSAELILGFIIARIFFIGVSLELKGIGFLRTVYMLPMMITPIVWGLVWVYIFNPTLGIGNYFLSLLGIAPVSWFGDVHIALYSIIFINVWEWTPFMMLLCLAGLSTIPPQLFEAAKVDGSKWYQNIFHIELPLIKRVIVIGLLMRIMDNFRAFDLIYVTTAGGPGTSTETLSVFAYRQAFQYWNMGYGTAIAIFTLILVIVLAQAFLKYLWGEGKSA